MEENPVLGLQSERRYSGGVTFTQVFANIRLTPPGRMGTIVFAGGKRWGQAGSAAKRTCSGRWARGVRECFGPGPFRTPQHLDIIGGGVASGVGCHAAKCPITAVAGQLTHARILSDRVEAGVLAQTPD